MCQVAGLDNDCIPRIATPFGGGLGRTGLTCGALSGAALAIGLAMGRNTPDDPRRPAYDAAQQVTSQFGQHMGSGLCRELTGFDLRGSESYKRFRESGVHERVCVPAVMLAARLAAETLKKGA